MRRRAKKPEASAVPVAPAHRAVTGRRRWLFRLAAVALPFLLLGVMEVALRWFGYGYDPRFFRETQHADGEKFLINNDAFTFRFFPPELSRCPPAFKIKATKPATVCRIFVLGESAAMGDPQPSVGPARILDVLLREKFPEQTFEVVNLGITAINSHVIVPLAREVAARGQGDIWILYLGNNEMVGPFGAATVFGKPAAPLALVRWHLAVQNLRLGQMAVAFWGKISGAPRNSAWGGMKMFLEQQVASDDGRRTTVTTSFERNLRDIIAAGRAGEARVVLSTVAVNLRDCPPFASRHSRSPDAATLSRFESHYTNGVAQQTAAQWDAAEQAFRRAAEVSPDFAELQFRWAQVQERQANGAGARAQFQQACDDDALPFRADTRINETIRAVGRELAGDRLKFCDVQTALNEAAPPGVAGAESFFEHVHFNFAGNYRIALLWAKSIAETWPGLASGATRPGWASQEYCEQAIGLSDWNRVAVIGTVLARLQQPPLAGQFTNPERMESLRREQTHYAQRAGEPEARGRARGAFEQALAARPTDGALRDNFASFLRMTGEKAEAVAQYETMLSQWPHDFYTRVSLGRLLGELGRGAEAEAQLLRAAAQRPFLPDAWYELGQVQARAKQPGEALASFDRVLALQPGDGGARLQRARVLAILGRRAEAVSAYRELIGTHPERWEPPLELAELFAAAGEFAAAIPEYQAAVRINPQHAGMRLNLGAALARANRLDEAVAQFQTVLVLSPTNAVAQQYLREVTAWREQSLKTRDGLKH